MATVIVRYKVKADKAEENIGYIEAVFEALKNYAPDGIRYTSMVADDGVILLQILNDLYAPEAAEADVVT